MGHISVDKNLFVFQVNHIKAPPPGRLAEITDGNNIGFIELTLLQQIKISLVGIFKHRAFQTGFLQVRLIV